MASNEENAVGNSHLEKKQSGSGKDDFSDNPNESLLGKKKNEVESESVNNTSEFGTKEDLLADDNNGNDDGGEYPKELKEWFANLNIDKVKTKRVLEILCDDEVGVTEVEELVLLEDITLERVSEMLSQVKKRVFLNAINDLRDGINSKSKEADESTYGAVVPVEEAIDESDVEGNENKENLGDEKDKEPLLGVNESGVDLKSANNANLLESKEGSDEDSFSVSPSMEDLLVEKGNNEKNGFLDNFGKGFLGERLRNMLLSWVLADNYTQLPGSEKTLAGKLDTRAFEAQKRVGIVGGALCKLITVSLIYGLRRNISMVRSAEVFIPLSLCPKCGQRIDTAPTGYYCQTPNMTSVINEHYGYNQSNCDINGVGYRWTPYNCMKCELNDEIVNLEVECDNIFEYTRNKFSNNAFIVKFSKVAKDGIPYTCRSENFLKEVFGAVLITAVLLWAVLKIFLAVLKQISRDKRISDIHKDHACCYRYYIKCFRSSLEMIYLVMDISLQSIMFPINLMSLDSTGRFTLELTGFDTIIIGVVILGVSINVVIFISLLTVLLQLHAVITMCSCSETEEDGRRRLTRVFGLGKKALYYCLLFFLFGFSMFANIQVIVKWVEIAGNDECNTIDAKGVACAGNKFLEVINSLAFPRHWPRELKLPDVWAITIMNYLASLFIVPPVAISMIKVAAMCIDSIFGRCYCTEDSNASFNEVNRADEAQA